jgi:hypothetical protein
MEDHDRPENEPQYEQAQGLQSTEKIQANLRRAGLRS